MSKRFFNLAYGLGAAVVIIGALFKINHWPFGDEVIAIGLITEAIVFTISAFEPVEKEYDWAKVYPELDDYNSSEISKSVQSDREILSDKLDRMLQNAGLDTNLMKNLKDGIVKLEQTAKDIRSTSGAMEATQKYEDQLLIASTHMESLNALYSIQLEKGKEFTDNIECYTENSKEMVSEFSKMSTNLSSLNSVYGGMLSAMSVSGGRSRSVS